MELQNRYSQVPSNTGPPSLGETGDKNDLFGLLTNTRGLENICINANLKICNGGTIKRILCQVNQRVSGMV